MNDCMWAVSYLCEEGEKLKVILANHQIHKTQTVIEIIVQARLEDATHVAAEF